MELELKGNEKYLKRMKAHLEKEHPTTRGKMKIDNSKKNGFNIGEKFLNKLSGGLK